MVEHTGGEPSCKHHWIIETPNGPTSNGVYKNCGEERPFVNYQVGEPYPRRRSGNEPDSTENQDRRYYRETGVVPGDSERTAESILPKNGTIGGRFR